MKTTNDIRSNYVDLNVNLDQNKDFETEQDLYSKEDYHRPSLEQILIYLNEKHTASF